MAQNKTNDQIVVSYLKALKDPESLADSDKVTELEKKLESTDDVIEQLRIKTEIEGAKNPSIEPLQEKFTEIAKEWADENGVAASAFVDQGVPTKVLREAGFKVRGGGGGGARSGRRVSADEVRAALPSSGETFTIKGIQESSGASVAAVRKVVGEGVDDGSIVDMGADPNHEGSGRAPNLYKVA